VATYTNTTERGHNLTAKFYSFNFSTGYNIVLLCYNWGWWILGGILTMDRFSGGSRGFGNLPALQSIESSGSGYWILWTLYVKFLWLLYWNLLNPSCYFPLCNTTIELCYTWLHLCYTGLDFRSWKTRYYEVPYLLWSSGRALFLVMHWWLHLLRALLGPMVLYTSKNTPMLKWDD
jgi:hypothetical protein